MKYPFWGLLVVVPILCFLSCASDPPSATDILDASRFRIISPYSGIDWENHGQYKAALHVHTTRSDGRNTLAEMIEEHYAQDFDILAITDHDVLNVDWVTGADALTLARYNEIITGANRGGRGMLRIPLTNEQSRGQHVNTFFANFNNARGDNLRRNVGRAEQLGGISHINHPGRYTGGRMPGWLGVSASNNRYTIRTYVELFMEFPSLLGLEIVNRWDRESINDRILWDNILRETIPQGRFVWGFSNDDSHEAARVGYSFNIFVMPANTLDNFRDAMVYGRFYAVARSARRELGRDFVGSGPFPAIRNIIVDDDIASITIVAEHYTSIDWIYGGDVIAQGNTISMVHHQGNIGSYVRANIIGPGGISFTQPFGITRNKGHHSLPWRYLFYAAVLGIVRN